MDWNNLSENGVAVIVAVVGSALTLLYKFFRILKNDKTSDQIDSDEQAFRRSLREECKSLRESNFELMRDKIELLERAVKAEAHTEYLTKKCEECYRRINGGGNE